MEVIKLPMGRALTLDWPEPAGVVFAFAWGGHVHIVRRTHPEEEPDSVLEREAARISREHHAARRFDKKRSTGL